MQVFHIELMKIVSENILLATGKFLMVIYFLTLTITSFSSFQVEFVNSIKN